METAVEGTVESATEMADKTAMVFGPFKIGKGETGVVISYDGYLNDDDQPTLAEFQHFSTKEEAWSWLVANSYRGDPPTLLERSTGMMYDIKCEGEGWDPQEEWMQQFVGKEMTVHSLGDGFCGTTETGCGAK